MSADLEKFVQVVSACMEGGANQAAAEKEFNEVRKNEPEFVAKGLVTMIGTQNESLKAFACVLTRRLCIHDGVNDVVMKKLNMQAQTEVAQGLLECFQKETSKNVSDKMRPLFPLKMVLTLISTI